jgi:DNA-binding transcriptional regulator GbsR (MarR family)
MGVDADVGYGYGLAAGTVPFVERFASVLTEAGVPRMPARVFAALMCTDSGSLTAAELADQLRASSGAISGAVRYLIQVNLASRHPTAGSRRDRYWVHDDVWQEAVLKKEQMLARWIDCARDGVRALGPDTPAGRRMAEMAEFYEFLQKEMPALMERWRAYRAELRG